MYKSGAVSEFLSLWFEYLSEQADLDEAVEHMSTALTLVPDNHTILPLLLGNLGSACKERFMCSGKLSDIEDASAYAARAIALSPDGHLELPVCFSILARSQFFRYQSTGGSPPLKDSLESFRKATRLSAGAPVHKFRAARQWVKLAYTYRILNLIEAYQAVIDIRPQLIWLGATTNIRYQEVVEADNLAVAAAATIHSSECRIALEWLEQARCVVWNQVLILRSPLDRLHFSHLALATSIQTVASRLHMASTESKASRELASNTISPAQVAREHRHLAKQYNDLLSEARQLPGFGDFLRPMKADALVRAARNGPIVVINCHLGACDALLIFPGQHEITHIPLPNFTLEVAQSCRSEMETSLRRNGIRERGVKVGQDPGQKDGLESVLTTLWNGVVKPVLGVLGCMTNSSTERLPHIAWCPTSELSFLPLHDARDYTQPGSRVFDYVISSYTPTLSALLTSTASTLNRDCRVLAVGQPNTPSHIPLPGTTKELAYIKARTQRKVNYSELVSAEATTTAVLDAMESHDWVHLACHAHQNVEDPTKSGFFLHDGTLDLASTDRRSFKGKGLAFLSACQTATGDEKLPGEAVHLASGMLMAGYTSVIAAMWSVNDSDAPSVADKVYGQLLKDGLLGIGEAGRSPHNAVMELRDKVGEKEFGRWVPYIHIGS